MNAVTPTAAQVEARWPVGSVGSVTPLGGGSVNAAYRVQAQAGVFHLRVYRDPRLDRARREHAAVGVARAAGIPTPRVLPTHSGDTVTDLNGHWAALFEVAPGAPIPRATLTSTHAAALGAFLADLHARLPRRVDFPVSVLGPPASAGATRQELRQVEAAIQALPHPDTVDSWALARTRERLAHLHSAPDDTPVADHLPRRFLHGDYHDGNVFFLGERPAAIIDWEQPRLAPRAWEIVRALHFCFALDTVLGTAFLRAYRAHQLLAADELRAGAELYGALQERNVWTYRSVYLEGNPAPRAFIRPPPYRPFPALWQEAGLR